MNENISDFFPFLQENAAELYGVMTALAAVLVMAGLMVAISRTGTDPASYLRTVLAVGIIALSIAFFPDWSNQAQSIAHGIVEKLDASPAEAHERFARLIANSSAGSDETVGFWDVLFADEGGIGHAVLYAFILLIAKIASAIMWLFLVLQQVLIQFQIGLAPVFLAMFLIGPLRSIAVQFQMGFVAVLLWPLGWAVASLMTDTLLKLAVTGGLYRTDGDIYVGDPQTLFFIIVVSLWILLSTIGAPLLIRKLLTTGANAGSVLLANTGLALSQGLLYGASAGVTASMSGASAATSTGAAAIGGAGGAVSGALGSTGVLIPSAVGIGAALAVSNSAKGGPVDYNAEAAQLANKARS